MRILQVISAVAEVYGGPAIGSVALNKALRDDGVDATIFTTRLNMDLPELTEADVQALREGGRASISSFAPSRPRRLQNSWKLAAALWNESKVADLVHIHGQYLLPHVFAYLSARAHGVPFGIQPHGGLEPYQRAQSRLQKRIYSVLIGNRILRDASYIQFSSQSEADAASDVVRPDQARVAPLGASLPFPAEVRWVQERIGTRGREDVFLFLGRLARKKNPDVLIDAWAARRDRTDSSLLIIAGPDGEWTQEELAAKAKALGVESSVVFTGALNGPQKAWIFSKAGTFVLPSDNENFGIALVEAMLSGCHVIASKAVAAAQFLTEANCGVILDSIAIEDLSAELSAAEGLAERTRQSGERAQEFAQARLSWSVLARSIAAPAHPSERLTGR